MFMMYFIHVEILYTFSVYNEIIRYLLDSHQTA